MAKDDEDRSRNFLSDTRKFKLRDYLVNNREYIEGKAATDVAEICSRALGFPVTRANVKGICAIEGVALKTRSSPAAEKLVNRIADLEARVTELENLVTCPEGKDV